MAEALAPLLRLLSGRWIAKEKSEVNKARSKDSFGVFNVLGFVYEGGEGSVEVKELLEVSRVRQLLAVDGESAGESCSYADNVLQALDSQLVDAAQRQSVAGGCFLELLNGNFVGLQDAQHFCCSFLNGGVKCAHPGRRGCP